MTRSVAFPVRTADAAARAPLVEENPTCRTFTVNPYTACDLRCVYCITGAQGTSEPRVPRDQVRHALAAELRDVPADALLSVGGLADAYPRVEADEALTREVVDELNHLGRPFRIITKGLAVERDVDLLTTGSCRGVTVSLCTVDEDALRLVDPAAAGAGERIALVARLAAAGIDVSVAAMPWIPGVTDARALIDRFPRHTRIAFAPLNVTAPLVRTSPFGRRHAQADVNRAYLEDFRRTGSPFGVVWQPAVPLDGGAVRPFAKLGAGD